MLEPSLVSKSSSKFAGNRTGVEEDWRAAHRDSQRVRHWGRRDRTVRRDLRRSLLEAGRYQAEQGDNVSLSK